MLVNVAYHTWSLPETMPQSLVSAFLGQASTTPVVAIGAVAFWKVWAVLIDFARALIPPIG